MDEIQEKSRLQLLRSELSGKLRHLPDYKIIELCNDYGIPYDLPDSNSLRILMLLCAAEDMILSLKEEDK